MITIDAVHYVSGQQSLCGKPYHVRTSRYKETTCPECRRIYQEQNKPADQPTFSPFTFIKAAKFFPAYAPTVTNVKHKMRGKDGNGQPTGFTEADKAAIRAGLDKFIDALKNAVIGLIIASCVVACSKDNPRPRPTPEEVQAKPVPKDTLTATADPDFAVPGK